jgi:hypothetical protein
MGLPPYDAQSAQLRSIYHTDHTEKKQAALPA